MPFKIAPVYSVAKARLHAYTVCLRAQLADTVVRVVELAPLATETPLFRGDFAAEMADEKGMPVARLVEQAIGGIEAGKTDVRPGLAWMLWIASHVALTTIFNQLATLQR